MKYTLLVFFLPTLLYAQGFEFQFEPDSIPMTINGWQPFDPWIGGFSEAAPDFCDIDADGDLDLFVGQFADTAVAFFRNNGTQTYPDFSLEFGVSDSLRSMDGSGHTNPDFYDLDNDSDLDALVGSGYVTFVRNLGAATQPNLNSPRDTLFDVDGDPVFGTHVALVDIDADGDGDLIAGEYWGYLCFYRNVGTPDSFAFYLEDDYWLGINVGFYGFPDPAFIDIDGDNDLDLFVGDESGHIWFYRNDGDSANYDYTYVTNNYYNIDVGDYASPEFADIDGDGDYDLFVGREANAESLIGDIYFYENIGSATNPQFQLITASYLTLDLGYFQTKPRVVDINGDQAPDLLTGTGSTLTYFQNVGDSVNPSFNFISEAFQGIYLQVIKPSLVDIDADGDLDLFAGEGVIPGPPTVALYLNRGTAQNPQFQLYDEAFITNPNFFVNTNPVLADIDADGDYDLFITDDHGYFYYYQNIGSSTWPNFVLLTNQWITYNYPGWRPFCFGDLDEDGDLDLLMESLDQWNLCYYNNQGTPQAANMVLVMQEFLPGYDILAANPYLVDIDNDGDLDLFVGEGNGGLLFFRNVTGQSPVDPRKRPTPTYPKIDLLVQPNPGNPASIVFSLPYPQEATLAVYNLLGAHIATLASGWQTGGAHTYTWSVPQLSSGIYLIQLATPDATLTQKLFLVK